jgi:hypothetical protein
MSNKCVFAKFGSLREDYFQLGYDAPKTDRQIPTFRLMYGFNLPDYTVHIPEDSNLNISFLMGCRVHACVCDSLRTN